jgi:uncharacterized protein with ParB-like and HNH nuclease domain
MTTAENIISEVKEARKEIKTDHYNMSVGEIVNLYVEEDISLNPAYQRLFRWDDEQKTKFIESLILGFPIPPLFVSQEESGHWDIVDGVQRISTILQLTGELRGMEPLTLTFCNYIPSLEGSTWQSLPKEIQRLVKRAKLSINIILTENSVTAQYEVFQRLNTGGLHLSDQEIRNCLIIMSDSDFYESINIFKEEPSLVKTTPITEDKFKEEYRMEIVLRYLIAKAGLTDFNKYKIHSLHVKDFIDKETIVLTQSNGYDLNKELSELKIYLEFLAERLGSETFVKYVEEKEVFEGRFSLQIFEAMLPGLATYFDKVKGFTPEELKQVVIGICKNPKFKAATARGQKALVRFKLLTELSFEYFEAI